MGMLGPDPWDGGIADSVEKRSCPTCVTIPNSVALGQTISAYIWGPIFFGRWQPHHLECGRVRPTSNMLLHHLFICQLDSPWNFVTVVRSKTRMMLLPESHKSMTICPFVYTQYCHWTDRDTEDRIGKTILRYAC